MDDAPVRSQHRRSGAETAAAEVRQSGAEIPLRPAVADPETRGHSRDAGAPQDVIAPKGRKVRPGPDGEREPAERARVEIDGAEPIFAQLELSRARRRIS